VSPRFSLRILTMLKKIRQNVYIGLIIVALVAIGLATINNKTPKYVEAEVVRFSTDTPNEDKPTSEFVWKGQKNDPKKIVIPSVGIDDYIQNVGIDQNNEIAVPNNVFIAGWFVDSVRPGDKGLSIIDGHIDGRQQTGAVFKNLPEIAVNDELTIVFGDNTEVKFRVVQKQESSVEETPSALYSQNPDISSQLNLITCVGNFDSQARQYDKRLIVSLEAILQ